MDRLARLEHLGASMSRYIDMTPTWPEALRMARAVIENGTDEGKALVWAELERMAEIAQAHVDSQPSEAPAYCVWRTNGGSRTVLAQLAASGAAAIWTTDARDFLRFATLDEAEQLAADFGDYFASIGYEITVGAAAASEVAT